MFMYKKFTTIKNNIIEVDVCSLRELLLDTDNHDKIIQSIIQVNNIVLTKYPKINYIISIESVTMNDLYYFEFYKEAILTLQQRFKSKLDVLYITNATNIFKLCFDYLKIFIDPDVLRKIKISENHNINTGKYNKPETSCVGKMN